MHYAKINTEMKATQPRNQYYRMQKSQPKRINSAQPAVRRELDKLSQKLNEEQRRKQKIRAQIDEIKSNMSQYQASMAAGRY